MVATATTASCSLVSFDPHRIRSKSSALLADIVSARPTSLRSVGRGEWIVVPAIARGGLRRCAPLAEGNGL